MRLGVSRLAVVLLTVPACSQDPDPAHMVAQIFEETRAESEAIWRAYCAANEDLDFRGQVTDLPGWARYVKIMQSAASKRLAEGAALGEDDSRYGGHAANVALNALRYEWLPERQLVRVWGDLEGVGRDLEYGDYVRVVQDEAGEWRLASWPPCSLEALFSERSRFPHRLSLTLAWRPAGDAPADAADPWFQLEHRGAILWDAHMPREERLRRSREFLSDVALPRSRPGEQGESLDGVLVRVPGAAPVALLLEVLAHLGEPGQRIPDVQLWVTGAAFPEYQYFDQRGLWDATRPTWLLRAEEDASVGDLLTAADELRARSVADVTLVPPWTLPGPDPVAWITAIEAELEPICAQAWADRLNETLFNPDFDGVGGIPMPESSEPFLIELFEELAPRFADRVTEDLPAVDPAVARALLSWSSCLLAMRALTPPEVADFFREQILVTRIAGDPMEEVVELTWRLVTPMPSSSRSIHLRRSDLGWKICAWPRIEKGFRLPYCFEAAAYVPDPNAGSVMLNTLYGKRGLTMDEEEIRTGRHFAQRGHLPPSSTILIWADSDVDAALLAPLLQQMAAPDAAWDHLSLQVLLDAAGRPGELRFDQSLTRPGADARNSHGLRLVEGETIQDLCNEADRRIRNGVTRFHLIPPQ